jgi:hypothetical protein
MRFFPNLDVRDTSEQELIILQECEYYMRQVAEQGKHGSIEEPLKQFTKFLNSLKPDDREFASIVLLKFNREAECCYENR